MIANGERENHMKKYAVISMDLEDWYHTYFPDWNVDRTQSLLDGLDVALDIMNVQNIKGSFFVVGEIVEQLSKKLQQMSAQGHDIACHGYSHLRPVSLDLDEFKTQLITAKEKIEKILGRSVTGYRAPSFGIDDKRLKVVQESGFRYDSSKLKPQKSTKYGMLSLTGFKEVYPCIYKNGDFTEFEVSTQKIGSMNMLLGGGYIRLLPYCFMKRMTQKYLDTGKLYIMYIHPIDLSAKSTPKVVGCGLDKYLRTHIGRRHMKKRFCDVIEMLQRNGYEFVTLEQLRHIVNEVV